MFSFREFLTESNIKIHSFGHAYHSAMADRYEADSEVFRSDSEVGKGLSPKDEEQWEIVSNRAKSHRSQASKHQERFHSLMGDTPQELHMAERGKYFGQLAAIAPGQHTDPEYQFSERSAKNLERQERKSDLGNITSK